MKKIFFASALFLSLSIISCGSDDAPSEAPIKDNPNDPNNPGDNVTVKSVWEPTSSNL